MNQIDIPDYQYYLGCNAKKMVCLTFIEKKFVFQLEFSHCSLILFSKILKFYRVKELFKVNQMDIPDYQYYLGCNAKKMVCLTFIEKKFVFQLEFSHCSLILFSKILKFYRVKELFKVNQMDIPDYQYYLSCNAKSMVCLTFLEKSSFFNGNFCIVRLFYFQKYRNFIGSRSCSK